MLFARRARCRPWEDVRVFESSWETPLPPWPFTGFRRFRPSGPPGLIAGRAEAPGRGGGRGGGRAAGGQVALCPQDALQEEYSRTGTFPGTPMVPPRRPWTLINWLFWASLLLYPFFRFLVNMVSSGSSLTLASFVLVFFVASVGVRWMIGVTEIDKGSAYGNMDSKPKHSD
ncbi:1-acyl-sn-glycerol-3-phosphate acyltransferase delta [Physeter macrocephalus]|uniref:1-acyl-sn-glycerol-3-phosphate acyltransferase delta n=1 Tax=Physeter macrocephalus TaxID=9755 RepID=A0A455BPB4_PHYMC|nr:1-acyl-sn-glycerol-3-phosphate acyltransferase delta [Physeter catodon]|eukprot:XP_028350582.1 1-acyl-sn-glycerol-3-phosphate acyltransferase delta [Physeter catodon]